MPVTFTRAPAEIEREEVGIGGKPPVDRRPTGGGGGGGDGGWRRQHRGPRARLHRIRVLCVCFGLAGGHDVFCHLVVLFSRDRRAYIMDPRSREKMASGTRSCFPPSFFEYCRAAVEQPDDRVGATEHLPRNRRAGRMARAGPAGLAAHLLGWRHAGLGIPWSPGKGSHGTLTAEGFAFDPLVDAARYFFTSLPDCMRLTSWSELSALGRCVRGLDAKGGVAADCGGCDRMVWHAMGVAWILLLTVLAVGR